MYYMDSNSAEPMYANENELTLPGMLARKGFFSKVHTERERKRE